MPYRIALGNFASYNNRLQHSHPPGMPLHLLHHKSWHVYNKDNVDRVHRDKQNAQRKQEEEELRMNQADQERRLMQLRGNAYETHPGRTVVVDSSVEVERASREIPGLKKGGKKSQEQGHVNLFEDVESGGKRPVEGNVERQIELAAEKKKWEDMLTSRLVNATKDHNPWYSQLDKVSGQEKEKSDVERELSEKKQMKWKENADPLKQMEKFLARKKEVDEREERRKEKMQREMTERERRHSRARTPENNQRRRSSGHDREDGEHKHRKRDRSRSRSKSPRREHRKHKPRHRRHEDPSPDLEKLRAEKAAREAAEKEKIARLMSIKKKEDRYRPVGHSGYSAQFHPEAVRR